MSVEATDGSLLDSSPCERSCQSDHFCCKGTGTGTYTLNFVPKNEGSYIIRVTMQDGAAVRFVDSNSTAAQLQVHSKSSMAACGNLVISQQPGSGSERSHLQVVDFAGAVHLDPELELSHIDLATKIESHAANGSKWSAVPQELMTGLWKIEYRSGSQVCNTTNLTAVVCMKGFDNRDGQCEATLTERSSLLQKIAGGTIGLLLVVAMVGVLDYFRRDPKRFRKLIMSFILNEVNVVVSLSLEIWDFGGG